MNNLYIDTTKCEKINTKIVLKISLIIFYLSTTSLFGCTTMNPQTESLLNTIKNYGTFYQINSVPFVDQAKGQCGPSTLTMVMRWTGKNISVAEITDQVYTPGMNGSLPENLIGTSRRQGFMAIPVFGLAALFTEIRAGHPVIVFENLAVNWAPQWHYAVVLGYDLENLEIILHSGHSAYTRVALREFESAWRLGDYWGLVVLPPNKLSASANELSNVTAAAALEQIGRLSEAKQAYQEILSVWPKSLGGLIGLANIAFIKKENTSAVKYLQLATTAHPNASAAWHNLAIAQGSLNLNSEAHQSTRRALTLAPADVKEKYYVSLKPWISE